MIFENIHYLLQFDDRGNLLALVSKSSGRNYIVKDGCSLFRLTMTEIIKNTKELPTCLLVSNDIMAMGIMNALKYAHYNVPKDVSIISFDNMPVAKYFNPAITSVNIHDEKIGIIAVRRMLEILEDDEKDYFVHNLVGVTLEIRESVYDLSLQNNMK